MFEEIVPFTPAQTTPETIQPTKLALRLTNTILGATVVTANECSLAYKLLMECVALGTAGWRKLVLYTPPHLSHPRDPDGGVQLTN